MDRERVLAQETVNDGQSVFLFYDENDGCYKAFGKSAYYADMVVTDGKKFYSDELQMPGMKLHDFNVRELKQTMHTIEQQIHEFYHFQTREMIGNVGYEKWKDRIKMVKD